ncbi:lanthionine synthetase LanC family protein [Streptomyces sp. 891-h]|uniref:lanthionine synthetase LanC family protein n=1 Tax=Streptomyces sp. 891-h TaxID=2720714 RepID=UPI001FAA7513|nr:lanthionine synthetase LanC family protein [Streptomyces sp. 891-h]UNZ19878.1 hypothetical protein HC362_25395 [Streptomyces sp. 891-h]
MAHPTLTEDGTRALAVRLAVAALARWTDRARRAASQRPPDTRQEAGRAAASAPPFEHSGDPGVPVLARLVAAAGDAEAAQVAARAGAVWARGAGRGPSHRGLYDGGLAGTLVGLRQCSVLHPALQPVADRLRERLLDRSVRDGVRYGAVTFPDYDLIIGPSGVLLALIADLPGAGNARGGVADPRNTAIGTDDVRRAPKGFGKGLDPDRSNDGTPGAGTPAPGAPLPGVRGQGVRGPGVRGPGVRELPGVRGTGTAPHGPDAAGPSGPGAPAGPSAAPGISAAPRNGTGAPPARGTRHGAEPRPVEAGLLAYAAHLAALCDAPDLPGLRAHYPDHPLLGWLHGRINTGMGHGVAGVTAALSAAVRMLGPRPELIAALSHTCHWLAGESFDDARDIRSWNGCGSDGAPRLPAGNARQGWCYGTPGVSWALWEAADVLGDGVAAAWAASAFTSLAEGFHEGYHLFGDHPGDRLGLCHGATGVLAVADALHRHGRLPAATRLRARLLAHLVAHEEELAALAEERCGLLSGAGGALAAMLTATGGDRTWLPCLGLR